MLELAGNTPINLSKPGSPAPPSEQPASTLPSRPQRPSPCHAHELVVHCQTHASGSAMASRQVPVKFSFHKSGIHPPVFVAGSFSNPPWEVHEMDATQQSTGEYTFTKTWPMDEGVDIQYKYRIGYGDWWVLDENEQVADDGYGNANNVLNTTRFATSPVSSDTTKPVSSRVGALRDETTTDRSVTPDFVKTTIEVSDSAALLHDEVPGRENTNHALSAKAYPHDRSQTPIEQVARTAAEVADTAAKLDRDIATDNEPPMLAHECMFVGSSKDEDAVSPAEHPPTSPRRELGKGNDDNRDSSQIDFDDPRLERFPSERSAIYATVRRLSTSVEPDDISNILAIPRSPGGSRDGISPEEGSAMSPTETETSTEDSRFMKASSAGQSPDRESGLKSVSSLHSIPEGDEPVKENSKGYKPNQQTRSSIKSHYSTEPDSADDEGIAMGIPSHERKPRYTWENKRPGRSGSLTDQPPLSQEDDAGPSILAINHTHTGTPHVMIHGPDVADDGEEGNVHDDTGPSSRLLDGSEQNNLRMRLPVRRPGTPSSVRSLQSVGSLQAPKPQSSWIKALFRVLFFDIVRGVFNKLFRR